jgi:hypothetical protein
MVKSGFVCFVFMVFLLGTLAAQDQRGAEKSHQVVLKYLGTAGWEITDGTTSILIDPYLSRINGPAHRWPKSWSAHRTEILRLPARQRNAGALLSRRTSCSQETST